MRTTLNLAYLCSGTPKGVFIGTREMGARGTTPGPKLGVRRDHTSARAGASRRAWSRLSPVSFCSRFLVFGPWF